MTDDENANIHTVSVSVPDWLKERFDDGLAEYEADDYKKRAAVIKDNSPLSMTVTDLSDNTLDLAAADYCDDWHLLEPEQQQKFRDDIRDWIAALIVGGVIRISPQSNSEIPPLEAE